MRGTRLLIVGTAILMAVTLSACGKDPATTALEAALAQSESAGGGGAGKGQAQGKGKGAGKGQGKQGLISEVRETCDAVATVVVCDLSGDLPKTGCTDLENAEGLIAGGNFRLGGC